MGAMAIAVPFLLGRPRPMIFYSFVNREEKMRGSFRKLSFINGSEGQIGNKSSALASVAGTKKPSNWHFCLGAAFPIMKV
jgi:hypothetical protein